MLQKNVGACFCAAEKIQYCQKQLSCLALLLLTFYLDEMVWNKWCKKENKYDIPVKHFISKQKHCDSGDNSSFIFLYLFWWSVLFCFVFDKKVCMRYDIYHAGIWQFALKVCVCFFWSFLTAVCHVSVQTLLRLFLNLVLSGREFSENQGGEITASLYC